MESTGRSDAVGAAALPRVRIECLPIFEDNYTFLLVDEAGKRAASVDPGDARPVLALLERQGLRLSDILITHHHSDHVGGNLDLLKAFPEATVWAGAHDHGRIPGCTRWLSEGDTVTFAGHTGRVWYVPGHTRGHIAYHFETLSAQGDLFIGDTLFGGGCGKLFEGTHAQLLAALERVRALGDATRVWCAHEYTLKNLEVAQRLGEKNAQLDARVAAVRSARAAGRPTVPLTLGEEKATNPFLRWDAPGLRAAIDREGSLEALTYVREFRDRF